MSFPSVRFRRRDISRLEMPSADGRVSPPAISRDVSRHMEILDEQIIEHFRSLLKRGAPKGEPCDLNDAIAEVVTLLRSEAALRQIEIECVLDITAPGVRGDRVQLQQVVLNAARRIGRIVRRLPHTPADRKRGRLMSTGDTIGLASNVNHKRHQSSRAAEFLSEELALNAGR